MASTLCEDDLCRLLADMLVASEEFRRWFLGRTGFAQQAHNARLLHNEQRELRPRKYWWRHWWCYVPTITHQRETDIFCVFETEASRFALHVENKRSLGRFLPGQAEGYRPRADFMAGKPEFMGYGSSETVLIAPIAFMKKFPLDSSLFDRRIDYESIARFIPEFAC